jgi:hypothetical protein
LSWLTRKGQQRSILLRSTSSPILVMGRLDMTGDPAAIEVILGCDEEAVA